MTSLTDWLLAQIAEDEAVARAVVALRGSGTEYPAGHPLDPARVLAECAAKRRIVGRCAEATDPAFESDYDLAPRYDLGDEVLRALASVYADRPGFREDWV